MTHRLTDWLTGVKCRATSVAKMNINKIDEIEAKLKETEKVINATAGCQSVLPQSLSTFNQQRNNPMEIKSREI